MRSVGVEEELLLVDAATGEPRAVSAAVLAVASREAPDEEQVFESELQRQQLEFATRPCTRTEELAAEIRRCRAEAAHHAKDIGVAVAALATSPLPVSASVAVGARYHWMAERFGLALQEQLTCGCHVHVSVDSDEEGVAVLDRIRSWLSVLIALSANSPSGRAGTATTAVTAVRSGADGRPPAPRRSSDRPTGTTGRSGTWSAPESSGTKG